MLTAIVADDEKLVRMTLVHKIPWEENNVAIVGEAANGREAYELCLEKRPDLLITDIAMPVMDGIELTQKINTELPETQVIFFSGIEDFNYVKTAMEINVKGYILKPIHVAEMIATVKRVAYNIALNKQRKEKELQLKEKMHENSELMKRLFLYELVSGYVRGPETARKRLEYFQLPALLDGSNCIALVSLDPPASGDETDLQFYAYSTQRLVEELLQNVGAGVSFSFCEDQVAVIFHGMRTGSNTYFELCAEIVDNVRKVLGISVRIGIGRWADGLPALSQSLRGAQDALDYGAFYELGSVIEIGDINGNASNPALEELNDLTSRLTMELGAAAKVGDVARCGAIVEEFFMAAEGASVLPEDFVKSGCLRFVAELGKCMSGINQSIDDYCGSNGGAFSPILLYHQRENLREYMQKLARNAASYFADMHRRKNSEVVGEITRIIEESYCGDISISYIAEKVYLTPNYISLIFKKETGCTITDYITNLRMEKAKELLSTTDLRVLDVAERVGYTNPYYFSSVFKKKTGFQPKNFQKPAEPEP